MRRTTRPLYLVAGLAAAFVVVSSVVLAIRQGSRGPIIAVGWIPAVIVAAVWPVTYRRRRLPRRRGPAS